MSLVTRFLGSRETDNRDEQSVSNSELADGALDTLSNVMRVMGTESFPLDGDLDSSVFPRVCTEFACHVEKAIEASSTNWLPACATSDNATRRRKPAFSNA